MLNRNHFLQHIPHHIILLVSTFFALFPIALVVLNSFKERKAIFRAPLSFPTSETFSTIGYETVWARANFPTYFANSIIVTVGAIVLILLIGAMAAFALSEYRFVGNILLGLYLTLGIMIPIRLGTIGILRLVVAMGLANTLLALILVYIAQGLPFAIFVLQNFLGHVPKELKEAARVDGASEYRVFALILPLIRPAIATVAIFVMIPIWNDLWFPLILAPGERTKTVTLGAQQFLGQFVSDWNAVLASLSLAMIPVLILYLLFSRQLIRGITAGAVK